MEWKNLPSALLISQSLSPFLASLQVSRRMRYLQSISGLWKWMGMYPRPGSSATAI